MHKYLLLALLALGSTFACAQSADIAALVLDDQGKPVADAVVVATPVDGAMRIAERPRGAVIDQIDKEFTPRIVAILVGTAVTFPNKDNVRHQVYSFSAPKRFELPLYAGVPAQPIVFDKPGVVVLGCNIHDWMVGYIYVSESPYFAKTGADGKAVITDVPPRAYNVRVWHPNLAAAEDSTRQRIDVARAQATSVEWKVELKPEVRVRRSPMTGMDGHY